MKRWILTLTVLLALGHTVLASSKPKGGSKSKYGKGKYLYKYYKYGNKYGCNYGSKSYKYYGNYKYKYGYKYGFPGCLPYNYQQQSVFNWVCNYMYQESGNSCANYDPCDQRGCMIDWVIGKQKYSGYGKYGPFGKSGKYYFKYGNGKYNDGCDGLGYDDQLACCNAWVVEQQRGTGYDDEMWYSRGGGISARSAGMVTDTGSVTPDIIPPDIPPPDPATDPAVIDPGMVDPGTVDPGMPPVDLPPTDLPPPDLPPPEVIPTDVTPPPVEPPPIVVIDVPPVDLPVDNTTTGNPEPPCDPVNGCGTVVGDTCANWPPEAQQYCINMWADQQRCPNGGSCSCFRRPWEAQGCVNDWLLRRPGCGGRCGSLPDHKKQECINKWALRQQGQNRYYAPVRCNRYRSRKYRDYCDNSCIMGRQIQERGGVVSGTCGAMRFGKYDRVDRCCKSWKSRNSGKYGNGKYCRYK